MPIEAVGTSTQPATCANGEKSVYECIDFWKAADDESAQREIAVLATFSKKPFHCLPNKAPYANMDFLALCRQHNVDAQSTDELTEAHRRRQNKRTCATCN